MTDEERQALEARQRAEIERQLAKPQAPDKRRYWLRMRDKLEGRGGQ